MDEDDLRRLDAKGYSTLRAVTPDRPSPGNSLARPHSFVCSNGRAYWLKIDSQQGLASELIAGRLASKLDVGPSAAVVQVDPQALPKDGSANHLQGTVVGTQDIPNTVNNKDLQPFMQNGSFDPKMIDQASRAAVVVFQTWIGSHGDGQVLVDLTTGRVSTIDHGDCFGALAAGDPTVQVTDIPGVGVDVGRKGSLTEPAIQRIEALSDHELLEAVARVPNDPPWKADESRRLEIARWLATRRDKLRSVITAWTSNK
jgi:hypothetical protein